MLDEHLRFVSKYIPSSSLLYCGREGNRRHRGRPRVRWQIPHAPWEHWHLVLPKDTVPAGGWWGPFLLPMRPSKQVPAPGGATAAVFSHLGTEAGMNLPKSHRAAAVLCHLWGAFYGLPEPSNSPPPHPINPAKTRKLVTFGIITQFS